MTSAAKSRDGFRHLYRSAEALRHPKSGYSESETALASLFRNYGQGESLCMANYRELAARAYLRVS